MELPDRSSRGTSRQICQSQPAAGRVSRAPALPHVSAEAFRWYWASCTAAGAPLGSPGWSSECTSLECCNDTAAAQRSHRSAALPHVHPRVFCGFWPPCVAAASPLESSGWSSESTSLAICDRSPTAQRPSTISSFPTSCYQTFLVTSGVLWRSGSAF